MFSQCNPPPLPRVRSSMSQSSYVVPKAPPVRTAPACYKGFSLHDRAPSGDTIPMIHLLWVQSIFPTERGRRSSLETQQHGNTSKAQAFTPTMHEQEESDPSGSSTVWRPGRKWLFLWCVWRGISRPSGHFTNPYPRRSGDCNASMLHQVLMDYGVGLTKKQTNLELQATSHAI